MALKKGDFVLINYTLWALEDGEEKIIDTTIEEVATKHNIYDAEKRYGPTLVVIGKSALLPAVEKALPEMDVGEKRVIIAEPKDAFGERDESLVIRLPKKALRQRNIRPVVGMELEVGGRRGVIVRVTERFAYVDFNHPLAGKKVKIELEVVRKIEDPTEKVKYLASRWTGIPESEINVELSNGEALVKLPEGILGVRDLEARLMRFISDVADLIDEVKKVTITFTVEIPREEKAEEEKEKAGEEAGTGEDKAEAEGREESKSE
jgi:peptidylprolyl isomerase